MADVVAASPSVEAGQPVDEQQKAAGGQAAAGGSSDAPGAAPGEVSAPEPKPRQRKERLPGVMTRDDGDDIFPELGFKSRTGKRIGRKEALAEADAEMREELGVEPPPPLEGEQQKKPEAEAPAPKKIKFADKEYETLEQAEQSFKSLQGMFKPLNERVTKAEELAASNAESARLWRQRAMDYSEGKIPTPPGQVPPGAPASVQQTPTTAKTAEQELQAVLQNVDGEMFETLARERGLPLAGKYLAAQVLSAVHDQMLPALRDEIMAQINPQLQPLTQSVEFQQQVATTSTVLEGVSQLRNPDGNVAFPELNDEGEMNEIAELWASDPNADATPQSLIRSIALYRLYKGSRGTATPTQPQIQVSAPATTMARPASIEQGGSAARPTATRAGQGSEDSRFARELDNVDLVDRTLGFAVRRRR